MATIKIATVALEGSYDIELNLKQHLAFIDEAAHEGASLVAFPEISLQGYPVIRAKSDTPVVLRRVYESAESVPNGPNMLAIEAYAKARNIHVVYGLTEAGDSAGVVYNTAVLTGPDGYIGRYRKVHLALHEQVIWRHGNDWPVYDTAIGRIGMLICYDKIWPESCRELMLRGAEIFVMPSAWSWGNHPEDQDLESNLVAYWYQLYDKVRAAENHRWFVSSNLAGQFEQASFMGVSQIVDPCGRVVATTGIDSGMKIAEVDVRGGIIESLGALTGARLIRDRRSETYAALRGELPTAIDG